MKRVPRAKILIADDDAGIRRVLTRMLTVEGYAVIEAGNGSEALELLERQGADVVLTDLYMPKVDGIELVIRLREIHPEVKVLVMSGGGYVPGADVLERVRRLGVLGVIAKPFSNEAVRDLVASVLREGPVP